MVCMCRRTPLPSWLTISRRTSGRDIRLSTATMRALDSRSPQLPTTVRPFTRFYLGALLLLLLVARTGQARSVQHHDDGHQPHSTVKVSLVEDNGDIPIIKSNPSSTEAHGVPVQVSEQPGDKQNLRSEVANESPVVGQSIEEQQHHDGGQEAKKIDEVQAHKLDADVPRGQEEETSVAKKRRRNDVAAVGKFEARDQERVPVDEVRDEGIRRFDARVDADGVVSSVSKEQSRPREHGESVGTVQAKQSSDQDGYEESHVQVVEESREEASSSVEKIAAKSDHDDGAQVEQKIGSNDNSDVEENRGDRSFDEFQTKPKRKSSTVYLSAEEKRISDGQQSSIVEGQIKKLISIRDDVLDAQKTDKVDGEKLAGSKREIGMDEVAFTQQEARNHQRDKVKDTKSIIDDRLSVGGRIGIVRKWREQAIALQSQIKDRNFLSRLKEQAVEVLPEIPKFTESQLLALMERIPSSNSLEISNQSYPASLKELSLTEKQLRIIRCAEQLLAVRERQSFVDNMVECIRGLSVLNCVRIFVWPIVLDNLPESVVQNLANLPIEINVFDLFQGNAPKSGRAQDLHRVRLLAPDALVYNILQDALESYPSDQTLVSYIDPQNETLKGLLTSNQLSILQMAEKFLPEALRREYSDRMFSCVRRFEYFSCVKYFAWPLIKQYFPALPAFPDYQSWYPIIDLSPQYPILPFPGFSEDAAELPEVVDADATRNRRPRPEAVIIQVLQNTLKEQPRISSSPSFLDQSTDTYVTLIPQDQLLTINMAEQLIPISYRPEFVQRTVRCMKEYNYLTCIKYSAWPTVRQFIPTLPDISNLLQDFQIPGLPDIGGYVPEIPTYPDVSFYWPISGATVPKPTDPPAYAALESRQAALQSSDQIETTILDVLLKLRSSIDKTSDQSPIVLTGNTITFTTFTKRQIDILRLAECLIPSSARATLITDVLTYLQKNNNFVDCARYVIWPTIARYRPNLPEFPSTDSPSDPSNAAIPQNLAESQATATRSGELAQERIIPQVDRQKISVGVPYPDKESRNRVTNVPVISVSGTRFVPIFTEHPDTVIYNILRSVQLQSFKANGRPTTTVKTQQFLDLLNDQQESIVNIVDALLPESVRPDFANKMIDCLRANNFLDCSRDVIWPTLTQYFPWLPSFPNFGTVSGTVVTNSTVSPSNQSITESGASADAPLSETNVKTGQHGDTTVTITDTRFVPIYNELPETIILNILNAVQTSVPNLSGSPGSIRIQELSRYLTEQQINILRIAESLLPIPSRESFIDGLAPCIKDKNFLECTRDIVWPAIAQSYPWLPSFPNFGSLQSLPQVSGSSSIRFQVFLSEQPVGLDSQATRTAANQKATELAFDEAEDKIEKILSSELEKSTGQLEQSYLNASDPIASRLSERQRRIIVLAARLIPAANRTSYVARFLECNKRYRYVACTNNVTWPILKGLVPSLPDITTLSDLFAQFPGIIQIPEHIGAPNVDTASSYFLGSSQSSGISQILQLPGNVSQLPGQVASGGVSGSKPSNSQVQFRSGSEGSVSNATTSITPSVGNEGVVPGYAGQPPGILLDVSSEKVHLPDNDSPAQIVDSSSSSSRKRRHVSDQVNAYHDIEAASERSKGSPATYPNITESEYLQLLIRIKKDGKLNGVASAKSELYLVDTLNSTIRDTLTADQYEILKIVEDLDEKGAGKGVASQVIQCILSLSFIRCLGIFIWPLITSNLPSLPSFPGLGIFGRSLTTENEVQQFFDMSTEEFERELLRRRDSIEHTLLDWYRGLAEDEFQVNLGFLRIKGYGNNEVGISVTGFREGRGAKLKDNKNLPSILTIISDIMEEVLDQRPESDKTKKDKDKDKKERSIDDGHGEADIQFLKENKEYRYIKRSMNDDEIIAMFLNKIKSNDSETEGDGVQYFDLEDAYDAFGVLFGTKEHDKPLTSPDDDVQSPKEVDVVSLESQRGPDRLKVLPLSQVTYDFEAESSGDQVEKQRQKRAKNQFRSFLEKRSYDYPGGTNQANQVEDVDDNQIFVDESRAKDSRSGLIVRLPRLDDQLLSRKSTSSVAQLARGMKMKMSQMMPGFSMVLSFVLQMVLAHARTAASMAGLISNMALGSAMFAMIRDSLMGTNGQPQIKYVYDNYKMGPGISWPVRHVRPSYRHGY